MGKAIRASVLVLLLTSSAQAGWIQNGSPTPPPTEPASTIQEPANAVQEPTTGGEISDDVADSLTELTLDLLTVLQSLY